MTTDSQSENTNKLPRIALIADVENWAYHNYAKQISRNLSYSYDFQIFFQSDYQDIEQLVLEVKDFDLIHFFWREALFSLLSSWVRHSFTEKGLDHLDFISNVIATANITTSVYDHLYLSESEIEERAILYNALAIGYTTVSQRLNKIYSSIAQYPSPNLTAEDGVDLEFFAPFNPERFYAQKDEIIVGWVGNSRWGEGDGTGIDHKGLETIIKPAIESLQEEGYRVRGFFADRQERWIPHGEMNDYYNSIDIYVCASDIEGTPNPALESMACGIPVISTDVGMIPQLFGTLQHEYILPTRSVADVKTKLKDLITNSQKREALSKENLESIKKWSWESKCADWDNFFKSMLSSSQDTAFRKRRDYLRRQALAMYLTVKAEEDLEKTIEQLQTEIEETAARFQTESAEKERMQIQINWMEESKFWKIRNAWFKVKHKTGLAKHKN